MSNYYQGKFILSEEQKKKYIGKSYDITYRSSWELLFMRNIADNENTLLWNSEEVVIDYIKPTDNKYHKYKMDIYLKTIDGKECLIEIKPYKQAIPPKLSKTKTGKSTKKRMERYKKELQTYAINLAKWKAAQALCDRYGMDFYICTEDPNKSFKYSTKFKLWRLEDLCITS